MSHETRRTAINEYCRSCICDEANGGRWTEQTAACSTVDCHLWRFRPVPRTAADWVKARDPELIPADWKRLDHGSAVRRLYENIDASIGGKPVRAPSEQRDEGELPSHSPAPTVSTKAPIRHPALSASIANHADAMVAAAA